MKRYLPRALPVVAVVVLLIFVIIYRSKRAHGRQASSPESPVETSPVEGPPPADENGWGREQNEPIADDLAEGGDFDQGSTQEKPTPAQAGDSPESVSVYDQVMEKINRMSDVELTELLDLIDDRQGEKSRKDDRKDFFTTVGYVVNDQYYQDFIQDLSAGGVFIKARQKFEPGQPILMTFMSPDQNRPFKISGEIVHTLDTGIGVRFEKESQVQAEAISALVSQIHRYAESG